MKGYKAFKPNWTCNKKQYVVGEVATQGGKLEMCYNGIHFCTNLADCFYYYDADPTNKLAEVEALGTILQSDMNDKCCTDRLKIVKELSIADLLKNKEFCLEVIKRNPYQAKFMKGQDREVFLAAVKQDSGVLEYVPEAMKTEEFFLAVVKQDGIMLRHVIKQTPEICMTAVRQNPNAVYFIRDDKLRAQLMKKGTDT